jgi:hypothetical protein
MYYHFNFNIIIKFDLFHYVQVILDSLEVVFARNREQVKSVVLAPVREVPHSNIFKIIIRANVELHLVYIIIQHIPLGVVLPQTYNAVVRVRAVIKSALIIYRQSVC